MTTKHIYKFEIDKREKEFTKEIVVNKFKKINQNVYTKALDLGDFVFYDGMDEAIIVERKEIKDFAASIIDGRYHEQHSRLTALQTAKPGCRIAYIVENYKVNNDVDLKKCVGSSRITYETILSSMTKLMFRDGIAVIRSNGIEDTRRWLEKMWSNLNKGQYVPKSKEQVESDLVNARVASYKKSNSVGDWWLASLAQIHGMSPVKAKAVAQKYPDVHSLIEAYDNCETQSQRESLISKIVCKNRAIGWNVSLRVYETIYGTRKPIKSSVTSPITSPAKSPVMSPPQSPPKKSKVSKFSKKTLKPARTQGTIVKNETLFSGDPKGCVIESDTEEE